MICGSTNEKAKIISGNTGTRYLQRPEIPVVATIYPTKKNTNIRMSKSIFLLKTKAMKQQNSTIFQTKMSNK